MTFKLLSMIGAVGIAMSTSSCVVPAGHVGGVGVAGTVSTNYSASVGLRALPYGYQTFHIGGIPYFFHNNYWYTKRSGRFYRSNAPKGYANYSRLSRNNYNSSSNRRVYSNNNNVRRTGDVNRNRRANVVSTTRADLTNRSSNRASSTNSFNRTRATRNSYTNRRSYSNQSRRRRSY